MSKGGGVSIPSSYTITLGSTGATIPVDADLDNIHVKELPRLELGDINFRMKELPVIQLAVTQLPRIDMAVKEIPDITLNTNLAITKIPDIRAHLPAHFDFGVSLLGFELLRFSVCGEAQVITEPYEPRRLELCA